VKWHSLVGLATARPDSAPPGRPRQELRRWESRKVLQVRPWRVTGGVMIQRLADGTFGTRCVLLSGDSLFAPHREMALAYLRQSVTSLVDYQQGARASFAGRCSWLHSQPT